MAINFDSCDNKGGFALGEEVPRFGGEFGEIDDKEVAGCAEGDGDEAFYLEGFGKLVCAKM